MVSEWTGPPDVDAALDFYDGLVELVQGRIAATANARELNDALSTVVAGLWCEIEEEAGFTHDPNAVILEVRDGKFEPKEHPIVGPPSARLLVEFELVGQPKMVLPWLGSDGEKIVEYNRPTLPPRRLDDRMEPELLRGTVSQSLVSNCARSRSIGSVSTAPDWL